MAQDIVKDLLAQAQELSEDKKALGERTAANRKALRTLADTGVLTDAQEDKVAEFYPVRAASTNGEPEA